MQSARAVIVALVWGVVLATPLPAQISLRCGAAAAAGDSAVALPDRPPDLVIRATATAEQVTFRSQPEVDVELGGCAVLDTVRVIERTNLPDPVVPGVTYRDVRVGVEILGYFDIGCVVADTVGGAGAAGAGGVGNQAALAELCAAIVNDPAAAPGGVP